MFEVEVEKEVDGLGLVMAGGSDANIEYNGKEFFFLMFLGRNERDDYLI